MKVLIVHNHYGDYAQGGEANVMEAEAQLLKTRGHEVLKYERTNAEIEQAGFITKLHSARYVAWSQSGYNAVRQIISVFKPDVMHVHNYWLLLTPAIFAAAKESGVATVLTLHNYRMICPGNQFLRKNKPCELCLDGNPWRVILHRCFPGGSLIKSILSLRLYLGTRKREYLASLIDGYIALSEFAKNKFANGGIPEEKIHVKPNFMSDPYSGFPARGPGKGAIFIGRLSPEKGINTLLKALQGVNYPVTIVGGGPLMERAREMAPPNVTFTGQKSHDEAIKICSESSIFLFPSEWYEGFPLSLLEAMALGRAIIASDLGPRGEMIQDGVTGLLFKAGDVDDLREKILMLVKNPDLCLSLGTAARRTFLERYTPERNYQCLISIYERILEINQRGKGNVRDCRDFI